jgi:hypothetical protein
MRIGLLALGLSVVLASFAPQVKAQNEGDKTTTVTIMPIKNVRAEVMAYLLTPQKQPSPIPEFKDKNGKVVKIKMSGIVDFPGIENITANAAKNELWVQGTPDSIRRLKEVVEFLDKPARSVEIKAQFVAVDEAEIAGLGIESDGGKKMIIFDQAFRDKLKDLVKANHAEVIQAAQITAMNNSTSTVTWNSNMALPPTDLQFTPTIQDDTVTMYLTPSINESNPLSMMEKPALFISTVVNLKRGDVSVTPLQQTTINKRAIFLLVSAQTISDQTALLD